MNNILKHQLINKVLKQSVHAHTALYDDVIHLIEFYQEQEEENQKLLEENKLYQEQRDKNTLLLKEKNTQLMRMLEKQAKMAAMGEMMDAIAHQWKQPLNALSMMSDMLLQDYTKGAVNQLYIEEMMGDTHMQINHLVTTLNEFRTFFKPNQDERSDFLLYESLKSVQLLMKDELIINNIHIHLDFEKDLTLLGTQNELKHLFINLINNTIDIFKERKKSISRHIYIRAHKENNSIQIEFEDNGGGIPIEIINDIFKAHVTSNEEGKGSGIGLYISSQIVQKHKGTITVRNSDMGALFTITLQE